MNKIVVIYDSKYGSTERYAQWIAQALSCSALKRKTVRPKNLYDYDTIIYGGGLYAGGLNGISFLTRNYNILKEKHVVLFTCGIANPDKPETADHIKNSLSKTLSPEMTEQFHLFHFRGSIDYSKLNMIHKLMMFMLRNMLLKKDPHTLSEEDKQLLNNYGGHIDFPYPKSIDPLVYDVLTF